MSLIRPFDACPSCHHGIVVHEPSGCVGAYGRWWDPDTNAIVGSYYSPKEPDCGCRGSDEPPVRHYVSPHTTRKGSVWCSGCHDWRVNCVHLRGEEA